MVIHFQPLAEQVYVYPEGCTYDRRDPHICTMDATYSHQGDKCYLSNIKGEFNKQVWRELMKALGRKGVSVMEYEHKGKSISVDLLSLVQATTRMQRYRDENKEMYS